MADAMYGRSVVISVFTENCVKLMKRTLRGLPEHPGFLFFLRLLLHAEITKHLGDYNHRTRHQCWS